MKTISAIPLAAALLLAGCFWQKEAAYESFAAAEKAGAVKRGWVPAWLPRTSRDLKEKHDTDGNIVRFAFDITEKWPLPSDCKQIQAPEARAPRLKASWWPDDVPPSGTTTHRHVYFACGPGFLAIDAAGMESYFWKP